jgi:hypothetical protein
MSRFQKKSASITTALGNHNSFFWAPARSALHAGFWRICQGVFWGLLFLRRHLDWMHIPCGRRATRASPGNFKPGASIRGARGTRHFP